MKVGAFAYVVICKFQQSRCEEPSVCADLTR